jgi:hypothetical protein
MKKLFLGAAVLVVAATLCLAGCPVSSSDGGGDSVREAADTFETTYTDTLEKTPDTVTADDRDVVSAALDAYDALDTDAQALLDGEKALLDSLETKITQLEEAEAGIFTITAGVGEDGSILDGGVPDSLVISRSGEPSSLTIRAADGLANIRWSLDGTDVSGSQGSAREITFAAALYPLGHYTLGLYAEREENGVSIPYSVNIRFTVEN